MYSHEMKVEFSNGTVVKFFVESKEALSQYHALGAIEVATGELVSQNRALIDSQPDD